MTEKFVRHPIWESSVRPLYPKCIWIDGGSYRNFILDHDIGIRRQPVEFTSLNGLSTRRALSCDGIEEDLQSLKLIGLPSDVKKHRRQSHLSDSPYIGRGGGSSRGTLYKSVMHEMRKVSTADECGNESSIDDMVFGMDRNAAAQSVIGKFDAVGLGRAESFGNDIDQSKNQLTERVLQWLDLAGRNTVIRHEFDTKKAPKRRISTASEAYNRKHLPTHGCISGKQTVSASAQSVSLKRVESVHHLSLTFNKDDVLQPCMPAVATDVPNERTALSFGEFFPTTYRCSRKFLTYRNGGSKPRTLTSAQGRCAGQQPDPPSLSNRRSSKQPKRMDSIENQYRSMIQRQILETNCNTQLAKKQLHIFMPSLSKKSPVATVLNGNSNDCDSCLSTIMSSSVVR